nr:hypothetical protein [uncultured Blautia sp.]
MAESLKTVLMSALTSKATPAESDTLIVGEGNVLKKISFSQLFEYLKEKLGINTLNTKLTNSSFTYSKMGGDYNNKLNSAYCIYNNDIVFAHLTLEIPDGLANGTLLATFPNGVNLKTSLGIGINSVTGEVSTINAINNCIYSAGSMHTGNYILDMVFKRA